MTEDKATIDLLQYLADHAKQYSVEYKATRNGQNPEYWCGRWDVTVIDDQYRAGKGYSIDSLAAAIEKALRDYAMQPGRCEKAVGRIPPLTSIRLQRLQDISEADAVAEGCQADYDPGVDWQVPVVVLRRTAVELYAEVWNEINRRKADRWAANPWVWALEWEPVGEG